MKKPIIGILAKHLIRNSPRLDLYIRDEVKDAIFYNGATPIGLVPSTVGMDLVMTVDEKKVSADLDSHLTFVEKELLVEQIKMCDGVVFQGGAESDAYEIFVARYCYENDIPMLCICEGQTNLLRAVGGSTKKLPNGDRHYRMTEEYVHDIFIEKDTLLYDIIKKHVMKVNSRHHFTPDDCRNLTVSAHDDEGNIEVVEDKSKRFCIGMRFHPESLYLKDENHNAIIKAFIDACKR